MQARKKYLSYKGFALLGVCSFVDKGCFFDGHQSILRVVLTVHSPEVMCQRILE